MERTELPISIFFSLAHPLNANPSIEVTELGISILVKLVQSANAL